ncbi:MAG: Gfo/Idh/MocA family oxidoreductase, partial [Bryobacterales bacterium]|nr:Gfo/Idh/MocA family oxidoreductase [Bryobacterales bacterium]
MSGTGRRDFLAGSVAALHSSLRAAAAPEIRTAFIGVGKRGTSLVEQVLEQANVKITNICDTDPAARDAAASLAKRDNPRLLTDYRKLLDFKDFEAVFIATPCYLHAEMTAACQEAGKYVYCEKPLSIT